MALRAAPSTVAEKEAKPMTQEDKDMMNALCVTLLQRVGKVEEIMAAADATPSDNKINLDEFDALLKKIDMDCEPHQVRWLFNMLDNNGSGHLDVSDFKESVRNSGAITAMYQDSLQNVGLTLIPAGAAAIAFGVFKGFSAGLDFTTAYVVEDSLSVDNLFVFLVIFRFFKVPPNLQNYCLNLGIYGAVVLRGIFIYIGLAAVKSFRPLLLVFSAILIYTSYAALTQGGNDDDDEEEEGPPGVIKTIISWLPTSPNFDGDKLLVKSPESGAWLATPLALCIIAVELSDILFAVDSIPAVFAVTDDPLIVFTSNIAAIIGLRSLYQLLSIAVQDLVYLETAVAVVLGFVGVKLGFEVAGFEISSTLSLAFIIATLGLGIGFSIVESESENDNSTPRKGFGFKIIESVVNFLQR